MHLYLFAWCDASSTWQRNQSRSHQATGYDHGPVRSISWLQYLLPDTISFAHSLWGPSVASEGGELWKRHRRVVGPAFNTKTWAVPCLCSNKKAGLCTLSRYQLIRETTRTLYQEMIEQEEWIEKQKVTIDPLNEYMVKVRQGFRYNLNWCRIVLVLSVDFGTLCIWDASVMGFSRHKRGRGDEFRGGNNCSHRDYHSQTLVPWLDAQDSS